MAQFWVMVIISGTSQHPKDVLFVCEFWWGMYSFGSVSPWTTPIQPAISAEQTAQNSSASRFFALVLYGSTSLTMGQHTLFELILQCFSRSTLSCVDFDHFWNIIHESVHACVHWWNISRFLRRGLQAPKQLKRGNFEVSACDGGTAQMAQFRAIGIISGASWHTEDVPFVHEFLVGDVRFVCYDCEPPKKPSFGDWWHWYLYWLHTTAYQVSMTSSLCLLHCSMSLTMGQHALFEPIYQWVHRSTATSLVKFDSINSS